MGGHNNWRVPTSACNKKESDPPASNPENLEQVSDWVRLILTTNQPKFSATTSEQSTEIFCVDQDSTIHCQGDHLFWSGGGIEDSSNLRVTIHQEAEVIQGIQQWRRVGIHAGKQYRKNATQVEIPAASRTG